MIEEDQKRILMIGGIEVFLPHRLAEVKNCVADATTTEGQPVVTIRRKKNRSRHQNFPRKRREFNKNARNFQSRG
jgi:hypothetical protein